MTLRTPVKTRSKLPDVGTTILPLLASFPHSMMRLTFLRARPIFPATRN